MRNPRVSLPGVLLSFSLAACSSTAVQPTDAADTHDASPADTATATDAHDVATVDATTAEDVVDVAVDGAPAADTATVDATDAGSISVEFQTLYDTVLRPRCANGMCHVGGGSTWQSNLTMPDAPTAFANLVNTRVMCLSAGGLRNGEIRVVPFDPDASVAMSVREDLCSIRHGNAAGITTEDLAAIETWIRAGAR